MTHEFLIEYVHIFIHQEGDSYACYYQMMINGLFTKIFSGNKSESDGSNFW